MNKLLYHPVTILVFTLICLTLSISLYQSLQRTEVARENIKFIKEEIARLTNQIQQTEEGLYQAEQPLTQEKIIRNELLMKKPGEYVVQLPDLIELRANAPVETKPTPWEEWLKLLLG